MADFEWDTSKDRANQAKHGVAFELAQQAFRDPFRVIAEDLDHGNGERRYFCFGRVGSAVMTRAIHLATRKDPDFRSGLLAEGKGNL